MKKFNKGDVVKLKSGGPAMTVDSFGSSGYITCKWFDDTETKSDSFAQQALKYADDKDQ